MRPKLHFDFSQGVLELGPHLEFASVTHNGLESSALKRPEMDNRREPRRSERLVVSIDAFDNGGQPFTQDVIATSISNSGALFSGISKPLRSGDLLWVARGGRRSRFKIVWVRDSGTAHMIQAAIHLVPTEPCPWIKL